MNPAPVIQIVRSASDLVATNIIVGLAVIGTATLVSLATKGMRASRKSSRQEV